MDENTTIEEFCENIKEIQDFPSLVDYILWLENGNKKYLNSSYRHLTSILRKNKLIIKKHIDLPVPKTFETEEECSEEQIDEYIKYLFDNGYIE